MAKERRKITPKKKMTVEEQEKVLSLLHKKDTTNQVKSSPSIEAPASVPSSNKNSSKRVQRVTVDFPLEIYEQMKEETENKGHTLKWFIVNLVKKHLADQ